MDVAKQRKRTLNRLIDLYGVKMVDQVFEAFREGTALGPLVRRYGLSARRLRQLRAQMGTQVTEYFVHADVKALAFGAEVETEKRAQ